MAYVMETVKQAEQNFLRLLKEGLQNQYINGVATNVYNNFLEEMESYRRLQSKKEEKLQHGLFNQDVMNIHQSLSDVLKDYNKKNPEYQISIFDINPLIGATIRYNSPTLNDKILPMNSQMLPKPIENKALENKRYDIAPELTDIVTEETNGAEYKKTEEVLQTA